MFAPFNCHFPLWPHLLFVFFCAKSSPVLLPCPFVWLYHPFFFGPYCSADLNRRSLAIDTLLARFPQKIVLVSDSIRLRSQISDFPIADRSHSGTPFKRHNPSRDDRRDQSFCDHDRDHNFDLAIRCAESLPRPVS